MQAAIGARRGVFICAFSSRSVDGVVHEFFPTRVVSPMPEVFRRRVALLAAVGSRTPGLCSIPSQVPRKRAIQPDLRASISRRVSALRATAAGLAMNFRAGVSEEGHAMGQRPPPKGSSRVSDGAIARESADGVRSVARRSLIRRFAGRLAAAKGEPGGHENARTRQRSFA
jgi:hypothetical protein